VAQALVDERGAPTALEMRAEADILLSRCVAAKSVCLDEAEEHCQNVHAAALSCLRGMDTMADQEGSAALSERVRGVADEAAAIKTRAQSAKASLSAAQSWSCAKPQKGEEWFAAWAQFFQLLGAALQRTRIRQRTSCYPTDRTSLLPPSPSKTRLSSVPEAKPDTCPAEATLGSLPEAGPVADLYSASQAAGPAAGSTDIFMDPASPPRAGAVTRHSSDLTEAAPKAGRPVVSRGVPVPVEVVQDACVGRPAAVPVLVETIQAAVVADALAEAVRAPLAERSVPTKTQALPQPSEIKVTAKDAPVQQASKTVAGQAKGKPVARRAVKLDDNARAEDVFSKLKESQAAASKAPGAPPVKSAKATDAPPSKLVAPKARGTASAKSIVGSAIRVGAPPGQVLR